MVYKSLNGLAPEYIHSMFVARDSVNPYSLRNTESKLAVPKPGTNYLKNSFSYSSAVPYEKNTWKSVVHMCFTCGDMCFTCGHM